MCQVHGPTADTVFRHESGGHRWQRVPPTERNGRVQTSTITVAVLPDPSAQELQLNDRDIVWTACRGSGPGGQHRNVTASAVMATHTLTGITAYCQSERSQHRNRAAALAVLRARVWAHQQSAIEQTIGTQRKIMIGSGQRGDKRRTIRVKDGVVTDHLLNRTWRLVDYLNGKW